MKDHTYPKSGDGLDAPHAQPAKTFNYYATNFIAFIKRISTPDGFLISMLCLVIAKAIMVIVRAVQ